MKRPQFTLRNPDRASFFAACGSSDKNSDPPQGSAATKVTPKEKAKDLPIEPAVGEPGALTAQKPIDEYRKLVDAKISDLREVCSPYYSAGDFTMWGVAYYDEDALIYAESHLGGSESSRAMRKLWFNQNKPVMIEQKGFDLNENTQFDYYQRRVYLNDEEIVAASSRSKSEGSSGMQVDLEGVEWRDFQPDPETIKYDMLLSVASQDGDMKIEVAGRNGANDLA